MEKVKCSKSEAEKEDARNGSAAAGDDDDDDKPVSVHGSSRKVSGSTRRSSKANWTQEEDNILRDAVQKYEGKSWKKIAGCLPGRTDVQCLHRWQKVLNPDVVKGPWSKEEDGILIELVERSGEKKWSEIAEQLPGRMGKQCRERWNNHLKPEINKAAWSDEEERILINAHAEYGNKWSIIAKLLPGRTENSVKNHWNCSLKRRLYNYPACGSVANHPRLSVTVPPLQANSRRAAQDPTEENQTPSTTGLNSVSNGQDLIRPRRDSDDNLESSLEWSYTGLCYEPFQRVDLEIFLSTGRFPSTESYIRKQPRSRLDVKELPCDAYSRARAILRSAAMSYRNVPSIIRKRAIQLLHGGVSTLDNDVAVRGNQVIKVDDDDGDRVRSCTFLSQSLRSLQQLNMWRFEGEFGDA